MKGLEMDADELLEGLRRARAALAERLQAVDRERRQLAEDIAALDRAAIVLDPNRAPPRPAAAKRRPRMAPFARHELPELIGQVLRVSNGPMTATGIAAEIADRKQISAEDTASRKVIVGRVTAMLQTLEKTKSVSGIRAAGERRVTWRLGRAA
jgi:hypothetical protein